MLHVTTYLQAVFTYSLCIPPFILTNYTYSLLTARFMWSINRVHTYFVCVLLFISFYQLYIRLAHVPIYVLQLSAHVIRLCPVIYLCFFTAGHLRCGTEIHQLHCEVAWECT